MSGAMSQSPLGDSMHNGVGQAGNKSFISYRLGYGVPGYTGFVPVEENVSIPSKEAGSRRAPLEMRSSQGTHGDGGAICKGGSTFKEDFSLTPAQVCVTLTLTTTLAREAVPSRTTFPSHTCTGYGWG